MNFKLAKEIYGITPWLMDAHSLPVMTSLLKDIRSGVQLENKTSKLNSFQYTPINRSNGTVEVTGNQRGEKIDSIAVIKLDGPITKSGGESSSGMKELSSMMLSMSREESVKAFIILADSGGGSSAAVGMMVDAINEIKKEKRVIGVVEKGGMAASACYGILSACNEIYAEDPMSVVGSVGTMIQFEGFAANAKTPEGLKNIRVYASKSTRKNEAFEQALNEDKYTLLVDGLLDPINEDFIKTILSNRPVLSATTFDDGRTHLAGKVVGTFIDGIKSFDEVVNKIAIDLKNNNQINTNNKRTMTKAEIKTANPEAYAEILAEGMAMEKDRAGAWLAHMATDSAAVVEGIASGGNISSSQREEFFVKQNSITNAAKMITNSAPDVLTGESKTNVSGEALESLGDKVEAAFDFKLN